MFTEPLPAEDRHFLVRAAQYLEKPSFLMRVAHMVGQPLERLAQTVPASVHKAEETALSKAMDLAIRTVPHAAGDGCNVHQAEASGYWSGLWHKVATGASGFAGGLFGLPGLALELPLSTSLMFRSIASIADDFGEDLTQAASRLECLTVFGYGGPRADEALESSYLATRLGLTILVQQASQFLGKTSIEEVADLLVKGAAPTLVRLVAQIAARFNLTVAEKVLVQAVPVVGAAGGAFVNVAFMDHFNTVARYHFGIRKLDASTGRKGSTGHLPPGRPPERWVDTASAGAGEVTSLASCDWLLLNLHSLQA